MKFAIDLGVMLLAAGVTFGVACLITDNLGIAGGGTLAVAISVALKRDAKRRGN